MKYDVFISYSSKDDELVQCVCDYLEEREIRCFFAKRDLPGGENFSAELLRAIKESEMLLLIFSANSNSSQHVTRELNLADKNGKRILPFNIENPATMTVDEGKEYFLSLTQQINAWNNPSQHYFELLKDICKILNMPQPTEELSGKRLEQKIGEWARKASNDDYEAQFELGEAYFKGKYGLRKSDIIAETWLKSAALHGEVRAMNLMGEIYLSKRDYKEAFNWFRLSALQSDADAQYNLGLLYKNNKGSENSNREENKKNAFKWFNLAAGCGDDDAQYELGLCYLNGIGVEKDVEKAISWFNKAKEVHNIYAYVELARCYKNGIGVEKDIEKCIKLYEAAKDLNSIDALIELSIMYETGDGVEVDFEKSFKYDEQAEKLHSPKGYYNMYLNYREGHGCEQDDAEAKRCLTSAADEDNIEALMELGKCYEHGDSFLGIKPDKFEAIDRYEKAADLGYIQAYTHLGWCYSDAGMMETDDIKATEYLKKAAEYGDDKGQYLLSEQYRQGDGVKRDDNLVFFWCKKSADQGYATAQCRLGTYYFYGLGTTQDFEKAVNCFMQVAELKQLDSDEQDGGIQYEALSHLGECYEHGYGINQDLTKALYYYKKAADKGERSAKIALDRLNKSRNK